MLMVEPGNGKNSSARLATRLGTNRGVEIALLPPCLALQ